MLVAHICRRHFVYFLDGNIWLVFSPPVTDKKDITRVRKVFGIPITILLAALLVGCGQSALSQTEDAATPTAAAPTATTPPTPVATNGAITSGHPCIAGSASDVQIGDLRVSPVGFTNLAYPSGQIPSNLDPSKPYQLTAADMGVPNPPVNPNLDNGYQFAVCNASNTSSHVIASVTTSISAFSAYSGLLNTWLGCNGIYRRPYGVAGGCGGGYAADEILRVSFAPGATTGAEVTATQEDTGNPVSGTGLKSPPLPVSLGPGQMLLVVLRVTPPTAAGTYTFAFGLNYDSVTNAPISTMQPTILDSAAISWNGQNCTKPALLSQIPADDTQNQYVCAP